MNYAMVFPKSLRFILHGIAYSDWVGNKDTRRSTSDYCFYVGECFISLLSKKPTMAPSSSEEEFYVIFLYTYIQIVKVSKKHIELIYVPRNENVAKNFTKALSRYKHQKLCRLLNFMPL
ncbi:hypothetical protein KP509_01G062400 [Ceratopteris richardii]|uniref:Uncharacterized protein n=1 Tax=Ceratopteris richardii TaxID=49495 RepID=A0A8T2VLB5_CERRI|nr:hypothetical protein KP509_01G062400 [Ceratopteris richardii]